jgi:hypothetical protein
MIIYGAGMAGLLAANVLRRFSPVIKEAQSELPNNHSALLRFRTPSVGDSCGIPFKKVFVSKAISYENKLHTESNIFFANSYSQKVTGAVENRSINDLSPSNRYVAPTNLISLMAENCSIEYDEILNSKNIPEKGLCPIISTIPMPVMMKIVGWEKTPKFKSKRIWTHSAIITDPEVSVYQTIYYPSSEDEQYRISVIGNAIISEHSVEPTINPGPNLMARLRDDFGIKVRKLVNLKTGDQKYGKILPIDERLRKEFVFYLTHEHGIYSLGRFATWRQLLLDDVVSDINVIENFINQDSIYDMSLYK